MTNWISSLLWIGNVIPNFKSHNIIMSARIYFMKGVKVKCEHIADEILTDYNILSRYHYTKSKNYLKRRYRILHWIPMFIGTPCISNVLCVLKYVNFCHTNCIHNLLDKRLGFRLNSQKTYYITQPNCPGSSIVLAISFKLLDHLPGAGIGLSS